jgi:hypothetical protein
MQMDTKVGIEKYFSYCNQCFVMPRASAKVVFVICFMNLFLLDIYLCLTHIYVVSMLIVDECYVRYSNYIFCYV